MIFYTQHSVRQGLSLVFLHLWISWTQSILQLIATYHQYDQYGKYGVKYHPKCPLELTLR